MPRMKSDVRLLDPPPRDLELRNRAGDRYQRLPAVEQEIISLLELPTHDALTARVEQKDRSVSDFVPDEAIAYFSREWRRAEQSDASNWLAKRTLERIDPFIYSHLSGLSGVEKDNAYGDIIEQLFKELFDLDRPRGEYFQIRFGNALRRRCIDRYKYYRRREVAARANRADDPRDRDDGEGDDPMNQIADEAVTVDDQVIGRDEMQRVMRYLQDRVPPEQLEAFILRRVSGWPIEGSPGPTLSEQFGKTPRTINNWIRAVEAAIASYPGGMK